MKSGASDPFAEDDNAPDGEPTDRSDESDVDASPLDEESPAAGEAPDEADGRTTDDDSGLSRDQLPFVLRRDRVKDERPEVHQLFVQRETHDSAVEAERALEDRLDESLSRTDVREAIYLAGMEHLDDAETVLREWGYDL